MNYGAIGFVVGHEITHGFDDQGSQRDKDGNLVNWWEPETKQKFLEKAQCIIGMYSFHFSSKSTIECFNKMFPKLYHKIQLFPPCFNIIFYLC